MSLLDSARNLTPFRDDVGYGVVNPGGKRSNPGKKVNDFLGSKLFRRIMIGLVIFAVVLILAVVCIGMLREMERKPITLSEQLVAKMTTTIEVLDEYNDELHSTSARSLAASLRESFNATNAELTTFLTNNYGYDVGDAEDTEVWASELEAATALADELEAARLNGILDRTYAREMILLIAEVVGMESEIMERSSETDLDTIMENSTSSLENISNGLDELQVSYNGSEVLSFGRAELVLGLGA